ncbi:uncharacterized protein TNCV_3468811 [Trichonephila clavipes]|nr:uncharacterized protein TNCV_3468811 [Trichonephila clavipes]
MEPKSKAERLVLSFPATAENYPKAIDQLKERFGREDLLVQIYVRELLNLVMKNAVSGRTKTDLSALYDELEGKLRLLESLGRTQEKYGDFLTPLVESCIPEEILMAWERKRNTETDAKGSQTLEYLMTFLRLEVQGEEMVQLAKSGFGIPIRKKDSPTESVKPTELTTASALASSVKSSGKKINKCIFCEKYHPSENCFNARKMSLNTKRQLLLRKGACFICLNRSGHLSKNCDIKNDINCSKCNSHFEIMCPKLNKKYDQKLCSIKTENSLSSNCNGNQSIYFQTLCVFIRIKDQERKVRVLIDTACENSYISESVTSIFKATPLREETIIHSLFGGNETKPKHHSVYSIEVSDLKRSYACCFEVLSEKKICGFTSKIEDKRILNELKNKEIILSDLNCKETEIGLLIGVDNIGKLLTGNLIEFDSGLTAIETKLGWTVIGKVCSNNKKRLSWPIAKIIELIPGRDGEIRTVRLKIQHGTVIRPVQRIFPLEVQAIANSDKELKEESVSVKSNKPEKVLNINDAIIKKYTSSGRLVKEPKRLDLLNYNCYRFETLPKSQRGEYVVNGDDLCE